MTEQKFYKKAAENVRQIVNYPRIIIDKDIVNEIIQNIMNI